MGSQELETEHSGETSFQYLEGIITIYAQNPRYNIMNLKYLYFIEFKNFLKFQDFVWNEYPN